MKKICMVFCGMTHSNGVSRVAIAMANEITKRNKGNVTLIPLFQFDRTVLECVFPKVKVKPVFGFYFRGFAKILLMIPKNILYKLIIRETFDIEIGFQYEVPTYIIAGSTNKEAKHIGWMHGYDVGLRFRNCYKLMDKMVCVSKTNAIRLSNETGHSLNVDYCYNPIDDERIVEQGKVPVKIERGRSIQFVSVGRMTPEKGYSRLLDIVARLKNDGYRFGLWLIGDGAIYESLKEKSKRLKIDDFVNFLGSQSNPHKYTVKADVFICSSFSEGYSTACTEAIILGVPVITTNCSGGEEIINEAECGILTGMDDNSLYDAMKKTIENPQLIAIWKKCLEKTKENFTKRKRIEKLLRILDL